MKRFMTCIGVLLAVMLSAEAQTYVNPILGGDYPDPTIMPTIPIPPSCVRAKTTT